MANFNPLSSLTGYSKLNSFFKGHQKSFRYRQTHFTWTAASSDNYNKVIKYAGITAARDSLYQVLEVQSKCWLTYMYAASLPVSITSIFPNMPNKKQCCQWRLGTRLGSPLVVYEAVKPSPSHPIQ